MAGRLRDPWVVGGLAGALLVALLCARAPVVALALVLVAAVAVASAGRPVGLLVFLLISNAVRWAALPLPLMASVFLAQKALLFLVLVLLLWRRPGWRPGLPPVLVLALGGTWTWVLSDPLPGLSVSQTVQSWATLVLVWLAVSLTLEQSEWRRLLRAISWVPLVSMAAGIPLVAAGLLPGLLAADATGTQRLSGATIPAYLAAMAACAVIASALLARESPRWVLLVVLNLVILLGTSGRGALIFTTVALLPLVVSLVLSGRRRGSSRVFAATTLVVLTGAALSFIVPVLLSRTETSGGLNSSGRLEAWGFFLRLAEPNLLFGRGLGAGPLASAFAPRGVLPDTFVAQHSEYVRLILELGVVGLVLFCVAMVITLTRVVGRAAAVGNGWVAASTAVGLLLYSGTDNTLTDFQFGVPVGLLLGAMAAVRLGAHPAAEARPRERWGAAPTESSTPVTQPVGGS